MNQCPNCNSQSLIKGKIASTRGVAVFSPDDQRFLSLSMFGGTEIASGAVACGDCGFVCTFTSPQELRDFVRKHCKSKTNDSEA